jgi:predicted kinase
MVVVVFGLPGSGKTFFARQLMLRINARYISSDNVRAELEQLGKYNKQTKLLIYKEMLSLMEKAITSNHSVVVDATFYKDSIRNEFKVKTRQFNSVLHFIEIKAADTVVMERLKIKREDSEADFKVYLKIKSEFEPLAEDHLILYSDRDQITVMLNKALAYINYNGKI